MNTDDNTVFEDETGVLPEVVAQVVWEEASRWLGVSLPKSWVIQLARKARNRYKHDSRFHAILLGPEASDFNYTFGRDSLYVFMRHWLAALLLRHDDALYRCLPASFANGHELPAPEPPASPCLIPSLRPPPRQKIGVIGSYSPIFPPTQAEVFVMNDSGLEGNG